MDPDNKSTVKSSTKIIAENGVQNQLLFRPSVPYRLPVKKSPPNENKYLAGNASNNHEMFMQPHFHLVQLSSQIPLLNKNELLDINPAENAKECNKNSKLRSDEPSYTDADNCIPNTDIVNANTEFEMFLKHNVGLPSKLCPQLNVYAKSEISIPSNVTSTRNSGNVSSIQLSSQTPLPNPNEFLAMDPVRNVGKNAKKRNRNKKRIENKPIYVKPENFILRNVIGNRNSGNARTDDEMLLQYHVPPIQLSSQTPLPNPNECLAMDPVRNAGTNAKKRNRNKKRIENKPIYAKSEISVSRNVTGNRNSGNARTEFEMFLKRNVRSKLSPLLNIYAKSEISIPSNVTGTRNSGNATTNHKKYMQSHVPPIQLSSQTPLLEPNDFLVMDPLKVASPNKKKSNADEKFMFNDPIYAKEENLTPRNVTIDRTSKNTRAEMLLQYHFPPIQLSSQILLFNPFSLTVKNFGENANKKNKNKPKSVTLENGVKNVGKKGKKNNKNKPKSVTLENGVKNVGKKGKKNNKNKPISVTLENGIKNVGKKAKKKNKNTPLCGPSCYFTENKNIPGYQDSKTNTENLLIPPKKYGDKKQYQLLIQREELKYAVNNLLSIIADRQKVIKLSVCKKVEKKKTQKRKKASRKLNFWAKGVCPHKKKKKPLEETYDCPYFNSRRASRRLDPFFAEYEMWRDTLQDRTRFRRRRYRKVCYVFNRTIDHIYLQLDAFHALEMDFDF